MNFNIDAQFLELLKQTANDDLNVAMAAQIQFGSAIAEVLREGTLVGDVVTGLFELMPLNTNSTFEMPLDLLAPGTENQHVAYTSPGFGRIPHRYVEGDYIRVPTYKVTSSIDWKLDYARDAQYPVVQRALNVLRAGFTKKINDDGWHVILAAAADRNILVYDGDANAGQFTKRLVSLMKTVMRRNGGGNTASLGRRKLTDLALSPEGIEDIRNWGVDQIDEVSRREIYVAGDGADSLMRVFGVNLIDLDEFGEGQEYQTYYTGSLGGSLQASDVELVVGLNANPNNKSLIMPMREDLRIFADPAAHRSAMESYYGWMQFGVASLESRDLILGSF
jgi:hypothetical protein